MFLSPTTLPAKRRQRVVRCAAVATLGLAPASLVLGVPASFAASRLGAATSSRVPQGPVAPSGVPALSSGLAAAAALPRLTDAVARACFVAVALALGRRGTVALAAPAAKLHATAAAPATVARADDPLLAEARAAAEAAKLRVEAEKLRVEAQELSRIGAAERRASRAGALLAGSRDSQGVYAVSLEELPARLRDVADFEPTPEEVACLAAAVGHPGEAFRYDELASQAFDAELARLVAERRQMEAQSKQREAAQQAEQQAAQQAAQQGGYGSTSPTSNQAVNDDRDTGTRILASLAYLLPLIDSIQFGLYFAQMFPIFTPIFSLFALPAAILSVIPFGLGPLLLFGACILLSSNRDYPRLVRFNLMQAAYLDVAFFLPNIVFGLLSGGGISPEFAALIYLGLVLVCAYCVFVNAQGEYPDGLPIISDAARSAVDGPANFGGQEDAGR